MLESGQMDAYGCPHRFQAVNLEDGATNVNYKGAKSFVLYWDGEALKLEPNAETNLLPGWILAQSTGLLDEAKEEVFWGDVLASAHEWVDKPPELRKVVYRYGSFWGKAESPYENSERLYHLNDLLETGWYKVGNLWMHEAELMAQAVKMRETILQQDIQASIDREKAVKNV